MTKVNQAEINEPDIGERMNIALEQIEETNKAKLEGVFREFKDGKNQNHLTAEHLQKIVITYQNFESIDKYAYRATPQELADNDFNLNIPRYVDTFEEEEEIDLAAVKEEIADLEDQLAQVRNQMDTYLKELEL